jgi:hypothetical protein
LRRLRVSQKHSRAIRPLCVFIQPQFLVFVKLLRSFFEQKLKIVSYRERYAKERLNLVDKMKTNKYNEL